MIDDCVVVATARHGGMVDAHNLQESTHESSAYIYIYTWCTLCCRCHIYIYAVGIHIQLWPCCCAVIVTCERARQQEVETGGGRKTHPFRHNMFQCRHLSASCHPSPSCLEQPDAAVGSWLLLCCLLLLCCCQHCSAIECCLCLARGVLACVCTINHICVPQQQQ